MSKRLVLVMLLSLLLVTAFLLGEGWMAGMAIGSMVLVPFCFLASVLFGQLLGLDRHARPADDPTSDDPTSDDPTSDDPTANDPTVDNRHPSTFEKKLE